MASSEIDRSIVDRVLKDFPDPETGQSIVDTGQVSDLEIAGDRIGVTLRLTTHSAPLKESTREALEAQIRQQVSGVHDVQIRVTDLDRPAEPIGQIGLRAKTVIAVGSGKGGVGKSTIAASIAFGLKRAGCQVGLMDADVYGPSIPHLLGLEGKPTVEDGRLQPLDSLGLRVMSMGLLVPPGEAVVWRGPMLHGAITQFLKDTEWGLLDYLIIDMPPGTGDIALTLSQLLPLSGAVVVCTPQDVALLDAVKAIAMFRKVQIQLLGLVENMSYFLCPGCGERSDIFGSGGARARAESLDVPFLGDVPINMQIRVRGDEGRTAANFEDAAAAPYLEAICRRLVENASRLRRSEELPSL